MSSARVNWGTRRRCAAVALLYCAHLLASCQSTESQPGARPRASHPTVPTKLAPPPLRGAEQPPAPHASSTPRLSPSPGQERRLRLAASVQALKHAHRQLDRARTPMQREAAMRKLRAAAVAMPSAPGALAMAKQDAWYRLGEQLVADSNQEEALVAVQQGLAVSQVPSVPLAGLLELQGRLLERSGGKAQAVEAYHRALQVNQALMQRSLEEENSREEQSP